MNDLIERIEAANGPDRDIDLAIDLGARPDQWAQVCHDNPASVPTQWCDDDELPRYTASIDAAMTLIPKGAVWTVTDPANSDGSRSIFGCPSRCHAMVHPGPNDRDYGATPALALCAAAMKSRAYLKETNNGQ